MSGYWYDVDRRLRLAPNLMQASRAPHAPGGALRGLGAPRPRARRFWSVARAGLGAGRQRARDPARLTQKPPGKFPGRDLTIYYILGGGAADRRETRRLSCDHEGGEVEAATSS